MAGSTDQIGVRACQWKVCALVVFKLPERPGDRIVALRTSTTQRALVYVVCCVAVATGDRIRSATVCRCLFGGCRFESSGKLQSVMTLIACGKAVTAKQRECRQIVAEREILVPVPG